MTKLTLKLCSNNLLKHFICIFVIIIFTISINKIYFTKRHVSCIITIPRGEACSKE
jgi:hypothetical protein